MIRRLIILLLIVGCDKLSTSSSPSCTELTTAYGNAATAYGADPTNKELCDHYRLDIIIDDDSGKFWEKSDYFMGEIIASGIVRQLWVSRETQKRIIQASIKTMGLPLIALIDE